MIREAMGWSDEHLHAFSVGGGEYADLSMFDDGTQGLREESRARLSSTLSGIGKTFRYAYDFGDGWILTIKVERILTEETDLAPRCLGGRRAGPSRTVAV